MHVSLDFDLDTAHVLLRLVRVRLADIAGMPVDHRDAFAAERRKLEEVRDSLADVLQSVADVETRSSLESIARLCTGSGRLQ